MLMLVSSQTRVHEVLVQLSEMTGVSFLQLHVVAFLLSLMHLPLMLVQF
jgi:hypothetical protein